MPSHPSRYCVLHCVSLQMEVFLYYVGDAEALEQGNCMQGGQKSVPRPETDIISNVYLTALVVVVVVVVVVVMMVT